MSAKIKELECALAAAHLQLRSGSDPPEDSIDRNPDLDPIARRRSYGESSGSLAIDQDGVSRFYGDTASSEVRGFPPVASDYLSESFDDSILLAFFRCVSSLLPPLQSLNDALQGAGLASIYHLPDLQQLNLPSEIIDLFNAFPFGMRDRPHSKSYFLPFVPTRGRALQLLEHYYQSFAWM